MTKPTITTRAGKGSALTWTEGDTNLTNLRDATITVKADTGGTDVVSDLNGTVTLVAGTNVTITGDNTAKTVTINASGGTTVNDLNDLDDVSYSGAGIQAGDILKWTTGVGGSYFENATNNLSGLSDVKNMMSPSSGDVLTWNSTNSEWENAAPSTGTVVNDLNDLDDVSYSGAGIQAGHILKWVTGAGYAYFENAENNLNGLSDVDTMSNSPSNGQVLTWVSADSLWKPASLPAAGITDVVNDTTPQLGGSLDVNGNSIVSVSNGNITIAPNGTGSIVLDGQNWPQADGTNGQVLQTNGSGQLSWATPSGGASGVITLASSSYSVAFPNTSNGGQTTNWTLVNNGGISGVSVSTTTFTLPAGTYTILWPFSRVSNANYYSDVILRNTTDSTNVLTIQGYNMPYPTTYYRTYNGAYTFTISGSKTFTLRTSGAAGSTWEIFTGSYENYSYFTIQIIKSS